MFELVGIITKLSKNDFESILANYDIGKYVSSKHISWALQNSVYFLKTTKNKYVLKIFEQASTNFIKYQIKLTNFLANKKTPVAEILKTKKHEELLIYKNKKILIQKFLEGKHPKKFTKTLLKDIAKKLAIMNKHLLTLEISGGDSWKVDHQFKEISHKNKIILGIDFDKDESDLLKSLNELNKKKLRKSVIHCDFHGSNLLVKNNKLNAVIDWDDSHKDYLAYEIAVFVMDSFVSHNRINKDQIKFFFKEYQKHLKLKEEEKKAIYFFTKTRFLGVIFWFVKQMSLHPDLKKSLKKNLKKIINKYLIFKKLSLEEFMLLTRSA